MLNYDFVPTFLNGDFDHTDNWEHFVMQHEERIGQFNDLRSFSWMVLSGDGKNMKCFF